MKKTILSRLLLIVLILSLLPLAACATGDDPVKTDTTAVSQTDAANTVTETGADTDNGSVTDMPIVSETPSVSDTPSVTDTPVTDVPTGTDRTQIEDSVPNDLTFDGKTVSIVYRGGTDQEEIRADNILGETVNDAVFNRNVYLETRFGINFEYIPFGTSTAQGLPTAVEASVSSGNKEYDIIAWAQYAVFRLATKGLFLNVYDTEYIDLNQPWWNEKYMSSVDLGENTRYFLMGDISLSGLKTTGAVFFNKTLYTESFQEEPEALYDTVTDRAWTIDKMIEIVTRIYADENQSGAVELNEDIVGCAMTNVASSDFFTYSLGFRMFERGVSGIPEYVGNREDNTLVFDKLQELYFNCGGSAVITNDTYAFNSSSLASDFSGGKLLFMATWLKSGDYLRDMKDYGIIPYPMLNELQGDYISLIQDTATVFSIPSDCDDTACASAVIEAMCAENYRTVFPAYYETVLKLKYSSDEITSQMIDIIHDTAGTDFGYTYNYALNGAGLTMRSMLKAKSTQFASIVAKQAPAVKMSLRTLLSNFYK